MEVIFGVLGVSHFFSRVKSTIINSTDFHGFIRPGGKTVGMGKSLRRLPPDHLLLHQTVVTEKHDRVKKEEAF
jgi:hypothetical protein